MKYEKFVPSNQLSILIESIIFIEIKYDELNSHLSIYLPNGNPVMVVHLAGSMIYIKKDGEAVLPFIFFAGLLNKQEILKPTGDLNTIIVVFKPNALYHIFRIPMCEITEKMIIPAEDLIGGNADSIYFSLLTSENNDHRVNIINHFFKSITSKCVYNFDITDIIIDRIVKEKGCIRVLDIIQYYDVAERTLRRNFLLKTGHPPKEFARIIRFKFMMKQLQNESCKCWSELVSTIDLVDQSHFIKEFKRFTGSTPNRIMSLNQQVLKMINGTV